MTQLYVNGALTALGPSDTYYLAAVEDANGHVAVGYTEFVQLPSGLLLVKRTDTGGIPLSVTRVTSTLTTTALAASAPYTQGWQDAQALAVTYVGGSVTADQPGTLVINFSDDGVNIAQALTLMDFLPVTAGTANAQALAYPVALPSRYFQWVYTNGVTAQGTFALYQTPMNEWPGDTMPPSLSVNSANFSVQTAATALPDMPCSEVTIKAAAANTVDVLIGNSKNQYLPLSPGENIPIPIVNVNLLYAVASTTGQVLHLFIRG